MILINGKFLAQKLTGTQRVSFEIIRRLGKFRQKLGDDLVLVVPEQVPESVLNNNFEGIDIQKVKAKAGFLFEHLSLGVLSLRKNASVFSFSSGFPIVAQKGIFFVHDLHPIQYSRYFSKYYSLYFKFMMDRLVLKKGVTFLTNSNTSRMNILRAYPELRGRVHTIYLGWEHCKIDIDKETELKLFKSFPWFSNDYYVTISALSKHKNLDIVLKASNIRRNDFFVIIGPKPNEMVLKKYDLKRIDFPDNVIFTGFLSEVERVAVIKKAKALISPSLFEGFGLPVLESLALGTPVVISFIEPYIELYGEVATFFDPFDEYSLCRALDEVFFDNKKVSSILERYSWDNAVKEIVDIWLLKNTSGRD